MMQKALIPILLLFLTISVNSQSNSFIDSLESVLENTPADTHRVLLLYRLSNQYSKKRKPQKSVEYAESALELATELDYKLGIAQAQKNIGIALRDQGDNEGALTHLLQALEMFENIGFRKGMAHVNYAIAVVKERQGNRLDALKNLLAALYISKQTGQNFLQAESHDLIGTIYKDKGLYPEALKHNLAALEIRKELGNKGSIARSYNNIGLVYKNKGDYVKALDYYFASLKIKESIGAKLLAANTHNNIGNIYSDLKNYTDALKHHLTALDLREEICHTYGIGISYINIGSIRIKQGQYEEANADLQIGLQILEEIGAQDGIASFYSNLSEIYQHQGNITQALKNELSAMEIFDQLELTDRVAYSLNKVGGLYITEGNYDTAQIYLQEGLDLALRIGNKEIIKDCYNNLSKLEKLRGNFEHALEYFNKFSHYKDSLLNEKSSHQIALLKIKFDTEKKDQEITLLNKDNEIKALQLKQQTASILNASLEAEKNKNEIELLNNSMELQELKLSKAQRDLEFQEAQAQMKDGQLVLLNKDRALKEEQLQRQKLVRNAMILASSLLLLVGLLSYRSFRLRKKLERQQVILEERKRISADLHDDIGSGLSKIMLLSELVKHDAKMPGTRKDAEKISTISQELSSNISEIIWSLNSNNDYVDNLVAYIRRYAADYFDDTTVRLKVTTPDNIKQQPIQTENRRNIFFAVKEALHNIIKHAKATEVNMDLKVEKDLLSIVIQDNGVGIITQDSNPFGNGLKNMRNRMESINGNVKIENNHGTVVTLTMPV